MTLESAFKEGELQDCIAAAFKELSLAESPADAQDVFRLKVTSLTSSRWRHLEAEPLVSDFPTCSRKRLLLLSNPDRSVFYYGLLALEYVYVNKRENRVQSAVYMEKLDSTGLRPSVKVKNGTLARSLVQGYVRYVATSTRFQQDAETALQRHGISAAGTKLFNRAIYCFARPQPEYLFRNSCYNKDKHTLNDKELVVWWGRTLSVTTSRSAAYTFYIPNEEHQVTILRQFVEKVPWKWGLPYATDALAGDVIPDFPDDVKGRLLKNLIGTVSRRNAATLNSTTVKDLRVYMEAAAEFRETRACLFALVFEPELLLSNLPLVTSNEPRAEDLLEGVLAACSRGSFRNYENALESAERLGVLLSDCDGHRDANYTEVNLDVRYTADCKNDDPRDTKVAVNPTAAKRPILNDVSSLVKRRRS